MGRRLAGTLGAIALLMVVPAHASALSTGSFFVDRGAGTVDDSAVNYGPPDSAVTLSGTASKVDVTMEKAGGSVRDIVFAAPQGEVLQAGKSYPDAERVYADPSRPGLDAGNCNASHGSFEVLDLQTDPSGKVTRFRAVFEYHCEEEPPASYGEVRYGFPDPTTPVSNPSVLRWPTRELHQPPTPRPIAITAGDAPAHFTTAQIVGPDAGSFAVTKNECANVTVAPGDSCTVWAQFAPTQPGQRKATLRLGRQGGGVTTTELAGYAYGGTTEYSTTVTPSDSTYKSKHYTDADGIFFADTPIPSGAREWWGIAVNDFNVNNKMVGHFYPPDGEHIQVGHTYNVQPGDSASGGAFLELDSNCYSQTGWFRVNELKLDSDGQVRDEDLSFSIGCTLDKPITVTGRFARRAGDPPAPASWMDPLDQAEWGPFQGYEEAPDPGAGTGSGSSTAASAPAHVTAASKPAAKKKATPREHSCSGVSTTAARARSVRATSSVPCRTAAGVIRAYFGRVARSAHVRGGCAQTRSSTGCRVGSYRCFTHYDRKKKSSSGRCRRARRSVVFTERDSTQPGAR